MLGPDTKLEVLESQPRTRVHANLFDKTNVLHVCTISEEGRLHKTLPVDIRDADRRAPEA